MHFASLTSNFPSFPTTVLLLSNFRKVLQEMTNSQATVESELVTLATLKTPVEQSCKSNIPACRETLTFGIQYSSKDEVVVMPPRDLSPYLSL